MGLDGAHRECQFRCDRLVAQSEHHVTQDVSFAACQRLLFHAVGHPAGSQGPQGDATHVHGM
jgi:hypothetical protein